MATGQLNGVLYTLRRAAQRRAGDGQTDAQLLECFISERDESAFEGLVRRHGPMVLGVCRRVLGNHHDAEDAFQVTFLVLARRAASLAHRELVGHWLYGTAYRSALAARAARRRVQEKQVRDMPDPEAAADPADTWRQLRPVLDRELSRLPEKYLVPIVLCDLEGRTRREAARQLGIPEGTLSGRLTTARRKLARRLAGRGLAPAAGALAALLSQNVVSACVPASLLVSTTRTALGIAAGGQAASVASAGVVTLMDGVLKMMLLRKLKIALLVLLVGLTAICGWFQVLPPLGARPPASPRTRQPGPPAGQGGKQAVKSWGVRATLTGHTDSVWDLGYSRDGTLLATASKDGTVRLWNAKTGKPVASLAGHEGDVHGVAFSADGKLLATAGADKTVRVWDPATGNELRKMTHTDAVNGVAFVPGGKTLAAWGGVHDSDGVNGRGEMRLWDPVRGKEIANLALLNGKRIEFAAFPPDGKTLITAAGNTFIIWDWDGKDKLVERQSVASEESVFVYGLALSPDGKTLAVTTDATIKLYDVASGTRQHELKKAYQGVWSHVVFSLDGKDVAAVIIYEERENGWVVQNQSMVRIWDARTGEVRETFMTKGAVRAMAFAPDGKTLAVGCRSRSRIGLREGDILDLNRTETEPDGTVQLLSRGEAKQGR
jgi:RNA polymerase sigma factor (sigma-70 family)